MRLPIQVSHAAAQRVRYRLFGPVYRLYRQRRRLLHVLMGSLPPTLIFPPFPTSAQSADNSEGAPDRQGSLRIHFTISSEYVCRRQPLLDAPAVSPPAHAMKEQTRPSVK